ncbi:hypothetical protein J437_LFUL016239 [Ladona fulva]|uniref:Uncharacterized protein n=1 Tax=Ladona fulva TaxID=123851 RepID=A0A8K0KN96_LADFU|nr:hypothetical protein J437_LFUL016239 [Ladona fulva]
MKDSDGRERLDKTLSGTAQEIIKRRRSRSNSLLPPGQQGENDGADGKTEEAKRADGAADGHRTVSPDPYRVAMVGTQGVGKTALISQFMTSECINAYDRQSRGE